MKKIKALKAELKVIHAAIKTGRQTYKQYRRDGKSLFSESLYPYYQALRVVREKHIAYCMLRGTPYEMIEPKVRDGNELSKSQWERINKIMEDYRDVEAVCDHAS